MSLVLLGATPFSGLVFGTLCSSYICLRAFLPFQTLILPISQKMFYSNNFRDYETLKNGELEA